MKVNEVIISPVLTEKATLLAKNKVYMFYVNPRSDKNKIKQVLEKIYAVKISSVRTMNRIGKVKRVGRSMKMKQLPNQKIAYVKVSTGKIDLFPQA